MRRSVGHVPTINYRNAIYQGGFNFTNWHREGFGIVYLTSRHQFIASHWKTNHLSGHTLIYIGPMRYMYGQWENGQPHGLIYSRYQETIVISEYDRGSIQDKIIIISQKHNIAAVVKLTIDDDNKIYSQLITRGQLFNKEHLDQFIFQCQWQDFSYSYETLVKYVSEHMIEKRVRIQLIGNCYYRYGFQKGGLAIVFDDQYNVYAIGMHQKNQLKGLGIKYIDKKTVEQGNWSGLCQVFAYENQIARPHAKLQKVYQMVHLKAINFQNVYLKNQAQCYYQSIGDIVKGELGKQVISGMIYTSRKNTTFNSVQTQQRNQQTHSKVEEKQVEERLVEEDIERRNLEFIKEEIYDSIRKKKIHQELSQQVSEANYIQRHLISTDREIQKQSIIHRSPVGTVVSRNTPTRQMRSRTRPRSPIFNDKSHAKSRAVSNQDYSPQTIHSVSPFAQKMLTRISNHQEVRKRVHTIPVYTVQEEVSPQKNMFNQSLRPKKHKPIFEKDQKQSVENQRNRSRSKSASSQVNNKQVDLKQYESPFDNVSINLTNSKQQESSAQAMPLSLKNNNKRQDLIRIDDNSVNQPMMGPRANFGVGSTNKKVIWQDQVLQDQHKDQPTKRQPIMVNPYEIRNMQQKFEQRKTITPDKNNTKRYKKMSNQKTHNEGKPFFPVHNNSAYLKQHQQPIQLGLSPPYNGKSKYQHHSYFQRNSAMINRKTFDSGNIRTPAFLAQEDSNKHIYYPIDAHQQQKVNEKRSRSRSQKKVNYYQEQFRKRMESSPQRKFGYREQENFTKVQNSYQKVNRKHVSHNNGAKVIQNSGKKAGYSYFFQ